MIKFTQRLQELKQKRLRNEEEELEFRDLQWRQKHGVKQKFHEKIDAITAQESANQDKREKSFVYIVCAGAKATMKTKAKHLEVEMVFSTQEAADAYILEQRLGDAGNEFDFMVMRMEVK